MSHAWMIWVARTSISILLLVGALSAEARAQRPPPPKQRALKRALPRTLAARKQMATKHEGMVWYVKHHDYWVREKGEVIPPDDYFFLTYEHSDSTNTRLLRDAGYTGQRPKNEEELWEQIGLVWNFLRENVRAADEGELSPPDRWPSFSEYAYFYKRHGQLAWHACFSKAHLFASLLGRMVDRDRIAIASAHHAEGGAPATATHVFVAVYVSGDWYYLDPTAVFAEDFPPFAERRSLGVASMESVDYEHPYKILVLPGSKLSRVPHLSGVDHSRKRTTAPRVK